MAKRRERVETNDATSIQPRSCGLGRRARREVDVDEVLKGDLVDADPVLALCLLASRESSPVEEHDDPPLAAPACRGEKMSVREQRDFLAGQLRKLGLPASGEGADILWAVLAEIEDPKH